MVDLSCQLELFGVHFIVICLLHAFEIHIFVLCASSLLATLVTGWLAVDTSIVVLLQFAWSIQSLGFGAVSHVRIACFMSLT